MLNSALRSSAAGVNLLSPGAYVLGAKGSGPRLATLWLRLGREMASNSRKCKRMDLSSLQLYHRRQPGAHMGAVVTSAKISAAARIRRDISEDDLWTNIR